MIIEKQPGEEWEVWFGLNNTQQFIQSKDRAQMNDLGLVILHDDPHRTRQFIPQHAINKLVTRKGSSLDDMTEQMARHEISAPVRELEA